MTVAACDRSLARLKTDRLDGYLLHWRGEYPLEETFAAFEQLRREGKVLSWGASNFDAPDLEEALAIAGEGQLACNQVLYHLEERAIGYAVIPWCEAHGVAVVSYCPLGHDHFPNPRSTGGRILEGVAAAHGATPRQVALRFPGGRGVTSTRRRSTSRPNRPLTCARPGRRLPRAGNSDMANDDLDAVAFPKLNEAQLAALSRCPLTMVRQYRDGEKLFEAGNPDCKFDVVKSGAVEIRDDFGETSKTIVTLQPGQFTGDITHLTGSPALVSGVASGDCEVYEVSPEALRELMNLHLDLADVILRAFIARWRFLREPGRFTGLRVIGSRDSPETFRVRTFLAKNGVPFTWLDLEAGTPVVAWGRKLVLRNPSDRELAAALGLRRPLEPKLYDLVVVGAGPAGLAAAVYGASEGLSTVVLEGTAPGGQAGRSMRIENYLGFPTGITGGELAERAFVQAHKFGAQIPVATRATRLTFDDGHAVLQLDGGEAITTRCLLIASGAEYRRLAVEGCAEFEGRGVYYAATPIEAQMCQGSEVVVVGGGNSAGQAAVFLAAQMRKVYVVIRGDDLFKDMSAYLAHRVVEMPNIEVLCNTEIRRIAGGDHLGEVELVNKKTGEVRTLKTSALFSFIGASPRTDWLPPEIERDAKGFVQTGPTLARSPHWTAPRQPFLLEASRPGVFAAGDVRSGSVKRVASAVGEGAMAVQFVHEHLRETSHGEHHATATAGRREA